MTFHYEMIDHVQLAAPPGSEEEARSFYGGILGFKEVEKPEFLKANGGVWFQDGAINIHIGIETPFVPAKKAHPAILVNNIDKLKEHLTKMRVDFTVDHKLPGATRFYITDPFGNRIEFLEWEE